VEASATSSGEKTDKPSGIASAAPEKGNDTATRISAGVGGGVGGCLVLAFIIGLIICRRRRNVMQAPFNHDIGPAEKYRQTGVLKVDDQQRHELANHANKIGRREAIAGPPGDQDSEPVRLPNT